MVASSCPKGAGKKKVRTYVSITMDTFQRLSHSLPALASKHNQLEGPGPLRPNLAGPPDIQLTGRAFLVGFHGALRSSTGKSKDIINFCEFHLAIENGHLHHLQCIFLLNMVVFQRYASLHLLHKLHHGSIAQLTIKKTCRTPRPSQTGRGGCGRAAKPQGEFT